jgi:hypothetical protein
MSKHTCDSIRILIPDYLDGKLSAGEEEELRQHLTQCSSCAEEAEQLRPLMQNQLPVVRDEHADVDWSRFSVALNAEIDRRQRRSRFLPLRSAVLLPVAATVLAAVALWFFLRPDDYPAEASPAYAVRIAEEDVSEIAPEDVAGITIEDITVTGSTGEDALFVTGQAGESIILEDSIASSELRRALVDDLGFETLVGATLEYFSTDAVIDAISDDDVALLASAFEIQDISLP